MKKWFGVVLSILVILACISCKKTYKIMSTCWTDLNLQSQILYQYTDYKLQGTNFKIKWVESTNDFPFAHESLSKGAIDIFGITAVAQEFLFNGAEYAADKYRADPMYLLKVTEEDTTKNQNYNFGYYNGWDGRYCYAVRREWAEKNNIWTMSDFAAYTHEHPVKCGSTYTYYDREDSPNWKETEEFYDVKPAEVKRMDYFLMHSALENGDIDMCISISSEGLIPKHDLVVLKDDKNFYPFYGCAYDYSRKLPSEIIQCMADLEGQYTVEDIQVGCNRIYNGEDIKTVAHELLVKKGFLPK